MFYQFSHLGSPEYLRTEQGHNFSFPRHLHLCFEIITIISGEMRVEVDEKKYVLKQGEALLVFPNQIHSLESDNSEHILCIFSPVLVQAYSTMIAGKIPLNNHFVPDSYLLSALTDLTNVSLMEKKGILYSLCGQFDRNAEYQQKTTGKQSILQSAFSFVEENFNGDCSLISLSKTIGYDYSYISKFFKKTIGISFNAYVNYYRLNHACYMMENTTLPIIQCAYESGFSSLRSFNRNFKTHFDMTPTEYRKHIYKS